MPAMVAAGLDAWARALGRVHQQKVTVRQTSWEANRSSAPLFYPLTYREVPMNTRVLGMLALVSLGTVAACDQSNTGSNNDLATASQDLSTGGPDMTSTVDMAGPTALNGCNTADFIDRTARQRSAR